MWFCVKDITAPFFTNKNCQSAGGHSSSTGKGTNPLKLKVIPPCAVLLQTSRKPPLGTGRCFKVSPKPSLPQDEQLSSLCLSPELVQACFSQHQSVVYLAQQCLLKVFNHWNNLHMELADFPSLEFLIIVSALTQVSYCLQARVTK